MLVRPASAMAALRPARAGFLEAQLVLGLPGAPHLGVEDLLELLREPGTHPLAFRRAEIMVPTPVAGGLGGREVDLVVTVQAPRSHERSVTRRDGRRQARTGRPPAGGHSAIAWFM